MSHSKSMDWHGLKFKSVVMVFMLFATMFLEKVDAYPGGKGKAGNNVAKAGGSFYKPSKDYKSGKADKLSGRSYGDDDGSASMHASMWG